MAISVLTPPAWSRISVACLAACVMLSFAFAALSCRQFAWQTSQVATGAQSRSQ
jgi:hypothetical protein